jgi:hypothetical protein
MPIVNDVGERMRKEAVVTYCTSIYPKGQRKTTKIRMLKIADDGLLSKTYSTKRFHIKAEDF